MVTGDIKEYDAFLRLKLLDSDLVADVQSRIVVATRSGTRRRCRCARPERPGAPAALRRGTPERPRIYSTEWLTVGSAALTFNHMVEDQARLDMTFAALADATRRSILARLSSEEMTVSEVARPYEMSLAAVSKHLKVLSNAGLVRQQRDGRIRRCRLDPQPLIAAADWIDEARSFWTDGFEALAEHLVDVTRTADPADPEDPQPEDEEND